MRLTAALAAVFLATSAAADPLGWSFAVSNDSIGEARDRWQSSSLQFALLRGPDWTGTAPDRLGQLYEIRLRSDILTPESLVTPAPGDRRHAGVFAFGVHSHADFGGTDIRIGGDLVVTGPQTSLMDFQQSLHRILGFTIPDIDDYQIGNHVTLDLSGEAAREFDLGRGRLRPFVEAQAGSEDFLRIGADLSFGALGPGDLLLRAVTTGHRVPAILDDGEGWSVSLGGDLAYVADSIYLPDSLGYELTPLRKRLRAGVHYRKGRLDAFYGLTWLGKEFEAQRETQFVGTAQLRYAF